MRTGFSTESAPDCKATYARFKKFRTGYPSNHVKSIMGVCEGKLMSSSSIGSDRYNTYVWRGDGISLMQITFRDRTSVAINQFRLQ